MRLHGILFSPQELAPAVHAVREVQCIRASWVQSLEFVGVSGCFFTLTVCQQGSFD